MLQTRAQRRRTGAGTEREELRQARSLVQHLTEVALADGPNELLSQLDLHFSRLNGSETLASIQYIVAEIQERTTKCYSIGSCLHQYIESTLIGQLNESAIEELRNNQEISEILNHCTIEYRNFRIRILNVGKQIEASWGSDWLSKFPPGSYILP